MTVGGLLLSGVTVVSRTPRSVLIPLALAVAVGAGVGAAVLVEVPTPRALVDGVEAHPGAVDRAAASSHGLNTPTTTIESAQTRRDVAPRGRSRLRGAKTSAVAAAERPKSDLVAPGTIPAAGDSSAVLPIVDPKASQEGQGSEPPLSPPPDLAPAPPPTPLTLAEKQAKLYEKAFGGRPGDTIEVVTVPARINGKPGGDVFVRTTPQEPGAFEVRAEMLARELRPFLAERSQADLADRLGSAEWVDAAALAELGITATFDDVKLEVALTVPPALQPVDVRSMLGLPDGAEGALRPATTSGYVTARARSTWRWSGDVDPVPDTVIGLDGALQHRGVVLEGGWVGDTTAQAKSRRTYTSLVYDDPKHAVRYSAGDFTIPAVGFHDGLALLGVSAARNFSLQPYTSYRPTGRFEFFLDQRAQVQIYVNGLLADSVELEAGMHDIRDFPLCQGMNRIRVVIPTASGETRTVDFSTAVSADLLVPGVHQFSYSLGFQRSDDLVGYEWSQPTGSIVQRVGLTPTITAQVYGVASPGHQVLGVGQSVATRYGNLSVDVAAGHDAGPVVRPAARLRYNLIETQRAANVIPGLGVDLEYRPAAMGQFTDRDPDAPSMTSAVVGTLTFPRRLRATLQGRHQFGGSVPWNDPSTLVQLGLQGQVSRFLSATLSGANVRTSGGPTDWRASLTLLSNLGTPHHTVRGVVRASSLAPLAEELSWNQVIPGVGNRMQNGVSITNSEDSQSVFAHAGLATSRGSIEVAHNVSGQAWQFDQATSVSLASSVAFADGVWGLSAPINGSFAIIGRQAKMKGQLLDVNPSATQVVARADRLGPAVLANLQPYNVIPLTLAAPDLPAGYELGPNRYHLLPGYKTGTVLRVGTEASILVRGVLQRPDGALAAFASGLLVNLSEPDEAPKTMFTNGSGRFFVEGLKPGQYEMQVFGGEASPYRFTLAPGVEGVSTLGTVVLAPRR